MSNFNIISLAMDLFVAGWIVIDRAYNFHAVLIGVMCMLTSFTIFVIIVLLFVCAVRFAVRCIKGVIREIRTDYDKLALIELKEEMAKWETKTNEKEGA